MQILLLHTFTTFWGSRVHFHLRAGLICRGSRMADFPVDPHLSRKAESTCLILFVVSDLVVSLVIWHKEEFPLGRWLGLTDGFRRFRLIVWYGVVYTMPVHSVLIFIFRLSPPGSVETRDLVKRSKWSNNPDRYRNSLHHFNSCRTIRIFYKVKRHRGILKEIPFENEHMIYLCSFFCFFFLRFFLWVLFLWPPNPGLFRSQHHCQCSEEFLERGRCLNRPTGPFSVFGGQSTSWGFWGLAVAGFDPPGRSKAPAILVNIQLKLSK